MTSAFVNRSSTSSSAVGPIVNVAYTPTAGNALFVWFASGAGPSGTIAISDNGSSVYTNKIPYASIAPASLSGGCNRVGLWVTPSVAVGTTQITAQWTGGTENVRILIMEYSGLSTSIANFNVTAKNIQATPGTGVGAIVSASQSVTSVPAMLIGVVGNNGDSDTTNTAGWNARLTGSNDWFPADQRVTSSSTYTFTATAPTHGGTDTYSTWMVYASEPSGPQLVQSSGLVSATGAVVCPLTGVTAGNTLIFVGFSQTSGIGAPTVNDSVATLLQAVYDQGAGGSTSSQTGIWYADNVAAGAHTTTMTPVATIRPSQGILMEWSGLYAGGSFDQKANSHGTTAQTLNTGSTPATTWTLEIAIAGIGVTSSSGIASIGISDPPSGFTSIAVSQATTASATACEVAYQTGLTTAATPSSSWTWTDANTRSSTGVIATFRVLTGSSVIPIAPFTQTIFFSVDSVSHY